MKLNVTRESAVYQDTIDTLAKKSKCGLGSPSYVVVLADDVEKGMTDVEQWTDAKETAEDISKGLNGLIETLKAQNTAGGVSMESLAFANIALNAWSVRANFPLHLSLVSLESVSATLMKNALVFVDTVSLEEMTASFKVSVRDIDKELTSALQRTANKR